MLDDRLRTCGVGYCLGVAGRDGSRQSREKLPDGTAMPLGEFQENLCLGQSLPIAERK
jgi:hypothetical protein